MMNYSQENCHTMGSNWLAGFVLLLLLFAIFNRGGRGGIFGGGDECGAGCGGYSAGMIAETNAWYRNFKEISDLQCQVGRNDAVLNGNLELGFRTVINNADNNKNEIILSDERRENQNLRDRVLRLEADNDKKDILFAIERSKAQTDAQIAQVACNMLTKPQVTGIGCSPCVVNPAQVGGLNGLNGFGCCS